MKKYLQSISLLIVCCCFFTGAHAQAKNQDAYFNLSSSKDAADKEYGVIHLTATNKTILLGSVMAYGENVKALNIQINNGFVFKLAPAQAGMSLNYVASAMNIVLKPGDKATIDFAPGGKGASPRQIFVSGQTID